ncbi:hypothetical protein VDGL01_09149 [Verticillium dahliae]
MCTRALDSPLSTHRRLPPTPQDFAWAPLKNQMMIFARQTVQVTAAIGLQLTNRLSAKMKRREFEVARDQTLDPSGDFTDRVYQVLLPWARLPSQGDSPFSAS